ncbi:hypothetical protein [Anaerolinea thermophila]|uniref:hypothetical protein n=1 Tax=Anaerolinea thermophila TaxID=167964 RepID=UPI0026F0EDFA|nr:hypothetical protein [Anaerolinea thermophila]
MLARSGGWRVVAGSIPARLNLVFAMLTSAKVWMGRDSRERPAQQLTNSTTW